MPNDYTTDPYSYQTSSFSWPQAIIELILVIIAIAGMWKIFMKAKQPGWAAIIPFYNLYILLKIVGRPGWWLILMLIPFVNIIVGIIVYHDLAVSFGKGGGFTVLLVLLPFIGLPMLGFGDAQYKGPSVKASAVNQ